MNGKENIINKILSDADEKCAKIVAKAEQTAAELKMQAESEAQAEKQSLNVKAENASAERIRNRVANAELDARKYKLNAKQKLIAECYDRALKQLAGLPAKEKQAFIVKLLSKYAEVGETVVAAKVDKEVITQKTLDEAGKKLVLSQKYHNGQGGVILEGNGYEKDLTLARVIEYLREQTEGKVAQALFGDKQ